MGMLMMEADMSWQLLPPALTNDEWNILGGFEFFLGYRESESRQIKVAKFEENIAEGKMDPDILSALNNIESFVSINIHQLQVYHSTISALFAKRRVKNPLWVAAE